MTTPLLKVTGLRKRFGGLVAVDNVSFSVGERAIVSVIGPNGAGKTTFFNLITGIYEPDEGEVLLSGRSITGLRPDQIAGRGLARTFQNIRLFAGMTVLENVVVARHARLKSGYWGALLQTARYHDEMRQSIARGMELLRFVGLSAKANELAGNLPYGEQRRLEIARALATEPVLLLLDEPSAGMNPQETEVAKRLIQSIRQDFGISVVLIEHDMRLVMSVSDSITVLDYGRKLTEGSPQHVRQHPDVVAAYLGKGVAAGTAATTTAGSALR
ncbi:ABC transporter ATP-binding protein [Chthonobacter albigriseus]|uniref:ABC transporter ATP-binding protein n=1 Tax=Chthonobacter albigriseus TaxID=1683161 RepID=UPI0015EF5FF7|nr:ABC transporter ATP-binding protein [Chthonobacter albigriseus]